MLRVIKIGRWQWMAMKLKKTVSAGNSPHVDKESLSLVAQVSLLRGILNAVETMGDIWRIDSSNQTLVNGFCRAEVEAKCGSIMSPKGPPYQLVSCSCVVFLKDLKRLVCCIEETVLEMFYKKRPWRFQGFCSQVHETWPSWKEPTRRLSFMFSIRCTWSSFGRRRWIKCARVLRIQRSEKDL